MDTLYIVFVLFGFLATVLLVEGLFLVWNAHLGPEARRIQERLGSLTALHDAAAAPLVRKRELSESPQLRLLLARIPQVTALDEFLLQSATGVSVATFLGFSALFAVIAAIATWVLRLPAWTTAVAAVAPCALWTLWLDHQRRSRMRRIEQQLPDALDLMARAMQAGHAFSSALRLVGSEGPRPIAEEFQATFDEINFGIDFDVALQHLARRVSSADLRFFVVAVVIQRETGGNLAEILTSIAKLIRERQKLVGTVRVLSAEGRLSAWILTLLPFGLALVLTFIHPEFIGLLWTDPLGVRMVAVALGLMVVGVWWMWRLIQVRI